MDLKSFLKWEEPVTYSRGSTEPAVYIAQKGTTDAYGKRLAFNHGWVRKILGLDLTDQDMKVGIGSAISINREEKFFMILFHAPKTIPQFIAKKVWSKSTSIQIVNRALLEDLWTSLNFPPTVSKQFLDWERLEEYKGVKLEENEELKETILFKFTYNPKSAMNTEIISNSAKQIRKKK